MGQMRDKQISEFAERAGIRPSGPDQSAVLTNLSSAAYDLIRIIELERSGIRDGDGYWSGCSPLEHVVDDVTKWYEQYEKLMRDAA